MPARYLSAETARDNRIEDITRLVKYAWDIALLFPEYGDEIIADLREDIEAIVKAEAAQAAEEIARRTEEGISRRYRTAAEHHAVVRQRVHDREAAQLATLVNGITKEGLDPFGYYVYLLWPDKDAAKPVYVGQSRNLFSRLGSHMTDPAKRYKVYWVTIVRCKDEDSMNRVEEDLIRHHCPPLNTQGVPRRG